MIHTSVCFEKDLLRQGSDLRFCSPARSPIFRRQGLGWPICLFSLLLFRFKMRAAVQVLRLRAAWRLLRMLLLCGPSLPGSAGFQRHRRSCAWGFRVRRSRPSWEGSPGRSASGDALAAGRCSSQLHRAAKWAPLLSLC